MKKQKKLNENILILCKSKIANFKMQKELVKIITSKKISEEKMLVMYCQAD